MAIFSGHHGPSLFDTDELPIVRIQLSQMSLRRSRQWGACWLGCELWGQLGLEAFWDEHLPAGREGTRWDQVLQTLVLYRQSGPGAEWRLHRHWFDHTAIADLLVGDFSSAEIHRLYECHDKILKQKRALFEHLTGRWRDLFDAIYEVLLYDLTSTYFESDPPENPADMRRFGYSRDKRRNCVQVVIALTEVEQAFKELKGNLAIRPIHHQLERRIESHIFVSFLAYWLQVALKARLKQSATGLTPRAVLDKFATVQMLDVHLPTTDGGEIIMARYTQPEKDLHLLLDQLKLSLSEQPHPAHESDRRVVQTF